MRARTVKPEFFRDRKMGQLGPLTALVYQALWVVADDGGMAECDPELLKGEMFTYWSAVGVPEITGAVQELCRTGRVEMYAAGDRTFCKILQWEVHQHIHKPSSFRYSKQLNNLHAANSDLSGTSEALEGHSPDSLVPYTPSSLTPVVPSSTSASLVPERLENHTPPEKKTSTSRVTGVVEALTTAGQSAYEYLVARFGVNETAFQGEMTAIVSGMRGIQPVPSWEAISLALSDLQTMNANPTPNTLRAFARKAAQFLAAPNGNGVLHEAADNEFDALALAEFAKLTTEERAERGLPPTPGPDDVRLYREHFAKVAK
jgi:hypothetical protein